MTSDPIGLLGGMNTYNYSEARPLLVYDYTGESPCINCYLACILTGEFIRETILAGIVCYFGPPGVILRFGRRATKKQRKHLRYGFCAGTVIYVWGTYTKCRQ